MGECFVYMYAVYRMHAQCSWRSEEGVGFHGADTVSGFELPCGCVESNQGPLPEQ